MDIRKKVNLIIYRFKEQGLEVFLMNEQEQEQWGFLQGDMKQQAADQDSVIELDPIEENDGKTEEAIAVEAEWHEIPSLKAMLYEDAVTLKDKLSELDHGVFVTVKDALKKVLPHQYAFLKELKDILHDRNSVRDL